MAERNDFKRFRIVKLKEYLQQRGITCSIKKKNILLRLCMLAKELDLKSETSIRRNDESSPVTTKKKEKKGDLVPVDDVTFWAHKKTRSIVERGIGQLKRRFHVLHGEVRLSPDKTCQVIVACCILHNICKDRQIPCPLDGDLDDNQQNDGLNVQNGQQNDGIRYRQLFAETHF